MADVAEKLALPVILVVGLRLGCLNHALLTRDALRARGLAFAGWVANKLADRNAVRDREYRHAEQPIWRATARPLYPRAAWGQTLGLSHLSTPAWAIEAAKRLVSH